MLTIAENCLGKLLDYNDISSLLSFQDWLMLPMDVIEILLNECAKNDHRNIRYIEKVAIDWAEKGIHSKEAAQEYLKTYNSDYREILKALGLKNREPIEAEINYMDKWLKVYAMPMDVIKEACSKTVLQTGKGSFAYADGIISRWSESNIITLDSVKEQEQAYNNTKSTNPTKTVQQLMKKAPVAKKNKFVNYEQRKWDFDKINQLEKLHLKEILEKKG